MLKRFIRRSTLVATGRVSHILTTLLRHQASSGRLLVLAAAVAVIIVNSPFSVDFQRFWEQTFVISIDGLSVGGSLQHWVNEGLMTIFFLVAGLEIKRQFVKGELRTVRTASLPIIAALGGMVVPAIIYTWVNHGFAGASGWGIPMTTDTAIAVGMLALLGNRVSSSLKIFLLTLSVVDDIGAIAVITTFYSHLTSFTGIALAVLILGVIGLLKWLRLLRFGVFVGLGILLWVAIHSSGIPAAITGVLLGLAAPIVAHRKDKRTIAGRLERALIPVSAFVVVPIFALANAGVLLDLSVFQDNAAALVGLGIALGLVAGKLIGVFMASWLLVRFTPVQLPLDMNWRGVFGVGLIAGIGFTISVFIAKLAFSDPGLIAAAKLSIFGASLVSAGFGLLWLRVTIRKNADSESSEAR